MLSPDSPTSKRSRGRYSNVEPNREDVRSLVERLCASVLRSAFHTETDGASLSVSRTNRPDWSSQKGKAVKTLLHAAYDILLLKKWVWFGSWTTPLSPVCECVAFGYKCYQRGLHQEGENLNCSLQTFLDRGKHKNLRTSAIGNLFLCCRLF